MGPCPTCHQGGGLGPERKKRPAWGEFMINHSVYLTNLHYLCTMLTASGQALVAMACARAASNPTNDIADEDNGIPFGPMGTDGPVRVSRR